MAQEIWGYAIRYKHCGRDSTRSGYTVSELEECAIDATMIRNQLFVEDVTIVPLFHPRSRLGRREVGKTGK